MDRNIDKVIASVNAIAGKNKEMVKEWILTQRISGKSEDNEGFVSDEYADRLASLVMASHYIVSEAIMQLFNLYCLCGINPELSPSFNSKILTQAIPAHAHTLQEKATDLSLRASSAKHKKSDNKLKDSELGF